MEGEFTLILRKRGNWYAVCIEEIPRVNTQKRNFAEARRNPKEALALILGTRNELEGKRF